MTAVATSIEHDIWQALGTVIDPELDEPVTDLGFVRSIDITDAGVEVHLRLPTSFCSPNFAYLMASDAVDALRQVGGLREVRVMLDDHHDSDKINAGLAASAGYRGTFGVEAEDSLDELRETFQRKAHIAAMERVLARLIGDGKLTVDDVPSLRLSELPDSPQRTALLRRRVDIGLTIKPWDRVFVDDHGTPIPVSDIPAKLRFARAVRVSMEGNSHFCRGLLATRYEDDEPEGMPTRITNSRSTS